LRFINNSGANYYMVWAKKIKEIRYFEAIKQDSLANYLGVSQASVSLWERGSSIPPPHIQTKLHRLFGEMPSERLLRSIKASVVNNPNGCALFSLREDGKLILEARSQYGVLSRMADIGEALENQLGPEIRNLMTEAIKAGLFRGDIKSAEILCNTTRDGRDFPMHGVITPFQVDRDHWLGRADVRLLSNQEAKERLPAEHPLIIHGFD
jgi:transcriptional regulator with XRE-family HTH domain